MAHHYRDYSPDQGYLLPPNPLEWLSEDCLAFQVRDIVCELDLSLFDQAYSRDGRGAPAFAPQMLIGILLYAMYKGVYSSRGIMRLCIEDLGARYLCGGTIPDHRSINLFRLRHGEVLKALFVQSVHLCRSAGMVSLERTAIDGTKIAGNASRSQSMTYSRIVDAEARLSADVSAEVSALLERGLAEDAEEDARLGAENDGLSLPEHLHGRQKRLAALRAAKAALEERACSAEHARKEEWDATAPSERPHRKTPDPQNAVPEDDDRFNFVDPDSRLMKTKSHYIQGYNAQAAVDADHQVIVACDVTNECLDYRQLVPMAEQTIENTGEVPKTFLADAGYFSRKNISDLDERNLKALVPPDSDRRRDTAVPDPLSEEEMATLTAKERQRHLVSTEEGRAEYAYRMKTVEPVFGQIKGNPGHPGFTHFLRRGLQRCCQDWNLVCAAHNIRKLLRFRASKKAEQLNTSQQRTHRQKQPIKMANMALWSG